MRLRGDHAQSKTQSAIVPFGACRRQDALQVADSARDYPRRSRKATSASKTSRSKVSPSRSARSRERNARSDGMRISSMPACRGVALIRSTSCVTCRTENIRYPEEVWPKGDEQVAVVALLLRAGPGEQSQRLYHQRQPEAFVAAERKQSAR